MTYQIPSTAELRELLQGIRDPDLHALSKESDVPYSTLLKIRHGFTGNPRLETVRKILDAPEARRHLGTTLGLSPSIKEKACTQIQSTSASTE